MNALLQDWVGALGAGPGVVPAGHELLARYGEPHRHYHDRLHLTEVLQALRTLSGGAPPPRTVLLAAFWHDAVYDPPRPDNEEGSAAVAATTLRRLGVPSDTVGEVVRLVLLTTRHDPAPGDGPGALLCDADLAILAAPPDRYAGYASGVRREYAHLDDDAFRTGRVEVLRRLVDRPRLFTTEAGHRRWDRPARENLRHELARLGAPSPG